MIFNSVEFLLFAIGFFVLWPLARKSDQLRWGFITIASFIFYGWWDWRFLFLIIGSGLIDYWSGSAVVRYPARKKIFLIISLVGNLGTLVIFKYAAFLAEVLQDLVGLVGGQWTLVTPEIKSGWILPVGISFYTFQSLSYTIDIYRGRLKPTKNILHFFSYLSMFPQLVAGPIIRAKDFLSQLSSYRIPSAIEKWNAVKMICFGLFQKVVIADNLSFFIDAGFEGKSGIDGSPYWWLVMIAFSFQIYADFSGYSLIARGLAKYMGYHFKKNFDHPYLATSMREFWKRWHISLSTWFRDYVYIPLGGSRSGLWMGLLALTLTMLLSGLWHGAAYTYLMWATLHSLWLIIERLTKWPKKVKFSIILIPLVFVQSLLAWVYFRATSLEQGHAIIRDLFTGGGSNLKLLTQFEHNLFFLGLAILIEGLVFFRKSFHSVQVFYKKNNLDIVLVALAIVAILFFRGEGKQFIYFQF